MNRRSGQGTVKIHLHRSYTKLGIANPARRSPSCSAQAHARGAKKSHEVPALADKIADLEQTIRREAGSATTARLQTMPRLGPITAVAIEAFAPPM